MEKEEFLRLLPKLIREDDEVKGAIITALSGVVATKDDIARLIEHSDRRFEALLQQMNEGFEDARKERMYLGAKIDNIGARSGENLENAILYLLNDRLIQENIQSSKIAKEILRDEEGKVFWENYTTDIDILIQDGKTILIEVKYHPDNRDGFHFLKNAELFNLLYTKKYDELLLICLEITKNNLEQIQKQGIKVVTGKIV